MFKKLGKLLKKGAMSVEYIVIGVCVIGMAALATAFVSDKMSVAMGQENNAGDTNAGDNQTGNDSNDNVEVDPKTTLEYYGLCVGEYPESQAKVTNEEIICYMINGTQLWIYNYKMQTFQYVLIGEEPQSIQYVVLDTRDPSFIAISVRPENGTYYYIKFSTAEIEQICK